jgi:hypothetical protein
MIRLAGDSIKSFKIAPFTLPDMGEGNYYNLNITHNLNSVNLIIELEGDAGGGNWQRLQDTNSSGGLLRGYRWVTQSLNVVQLQMRYNLDFGYPPYLVQGTIVAI